MLKNIYTVGSAKFINQHFLKLTLLSNGLIYAKYVKCGILYYLIIVFYLNLW